MTCVCIPSSPVARMYCNYVTVYVEERDSEGWMSGAWRECDDTAQISISKPSWRSHHTRGEGVKPSHCYLPCYFARVKLEVSRSTLWNKRRTTVYFYLCTKYREIIIHHSWHFGITIIILLLLWQKGERSEFNINRLRSHTYSITIFILFYMWVLYSVRTCLGLLQCSVHIVPHSHNKNY
jgi:hypothetical protein